MIRSLLRVARAVAEDVLQAALLVSLLVLVAGGLYVVFGGPR